MTKVRFVIMRGDGKDDYHDKVDCAIRIDGTSPSYDFWNELKAGVWQDGRVGRIDPDSTAQIDYFIVLARILRKLIETGVPKYRTAINSLQNGIWEIKGGKARIPFFDVDSASGVHRPKHRITDRRTLGSEYERDDYWWYPSMDGTIRLTHGFMKMGDTTEGEDIEMAETIRREDLI